MMGQRSDSEMTELNWLSAKEPQPLLWFVRGCGERKRRLFAVACCRRIFRLIDDEFYRKAVIVNERFADGLEDEDLREGYAYATDGLDTDDPPAETPREFARLAVNWSLQMDEYEGDDEADPDEDFAILTARYAAEATGRRENEAAAQCRIARDIFGNPFRRTKFARAWRSPLVRSIAKRMYDERSFDEMSDLASALQEAGCEDSEILDHCRKRGVHVRGCWVVDLVLNKPGSRPTKCSA